jgi:LysR family glycine cleavage system transcriptional activator
MKRNLPPFASLRAFEAAARHESFKTAAEELLLTQSAVSHQIKTLEGYLGMALFERAGGRVSLTPKGEAYFHDICGALDRISNSTFRACGEAVDGPLFIGATAAFTSRWLMPRLANFRRACPGIELEIVANDAPLRFPNDGTDILIQYGSEPAPGFETEPFLATTRFPVCSAALIEREGRPESPLDLAGKTLLRDEFGDSWREWFVAAGCEPKAIQGPRMAHCELSLRAAKEGQGVALGYGALIEKELESGELVRLFEVETPRKVIYSLMYPTAQANRPRVSAFRNWIFEQAPPEDA